MALADITPAGVTCCCIRIMVRRLTNCASNLYTHKGFVNNRSTWSFLTFFASFRLVRNRPYRAMGFPTSGNDM